MKVYSEKEQIKYLDVDKDNKLTNEAIINFLQDIAIAHAEILGNGLNNKDETHTAWLILNWRIRVFSRPKYGETLEINTWVKKMDKCYSWREFEIYCNDELVAIANSKWVLINTENERITRVPMDVIEKYSPNNKSVFEDEVTEKLTEPENLELAYEETIGRTKIDTNNHLNNLYYLDYAIESLPEEVYESDKLDNIEIMYRKEIKYKEKVKCFYTKENNKHVVVIKSEDLKTIHAIIELY